MIQTLYDFDLNGAFGLARAQLAPVKCGQKYDSYPDAMCFSTQGVVSSRHTNMVSGLPNHLPQKAGMAEPVIGKVLLAYIPSGRRRLRRRADRV